MKIQLTISLLVSDRMATLGRCLSSLRPLLRELDSELIIVYTGSNPDTLALAEQYTSHIIPFTWCNDFAKARNVGLKAAKGEWFLYLDDDEWFEDTSELIYFFKSGEYKQYQSAYYIQRNYTDWEGTSYADAYVGRMCRLLPDTRFIYPIHENITPYPDPNKKFNTFVHHFGYVGVKNEAGQAEKSDRNLSLLLQRLKNEPESAHLYAQTAQEYAGNQEYDTAIHYCRKGLALVQVSDEPEPLEMWLMLELPLLISYTDDLRLALREGESLLDSPRLLEVGALNLTAMLVDFCWNLKEYEKGLKYVLEYRKNLEHLWKHPEKTMTQNGITFTFSSGETQAVMIYIKGLIFASEIAASEIAASASSIAAAGTNASGIVATRTDASTASTSELAAIKKTGVSKAADAKMIAANAADSMISDIIMQILSWIPWEDTNRVVPQYGNLEGWKKRYADQEEKILNAYHKLTIPSGNFYVNLQKAYYAELHDANLHEAKLHEASLHEAAGTAYAHNGQTELSSDLRKFWQFCAADCPAYFLPQLVEMAVRNGFSLKILLANLTLDDWNSCAKALADCIELPDMEMFYQKLLPELGAHPLLAERLNQYFLEKQLTQGLLEPSHLLQLLDKYCESVISDARLIYRDEILNNQDSYILPVQYKFAVRIRDVLQLIETGDYAKCVPLLTESLHLYPRLSIAVSGLTKYLNEKLKTPPQPASAEFAMLGGQVKQMLYGLIGNGQWNEAYGVNAQLISLLPDDLEILRLKQEILRQGL